MRSGTVVISLSSNILFPIFRQLPGDLGQAPAGTVPTVSIPTLLTPVLAMLRYLREDIRL